jgi:Tfp pilus assembly protein PilE
VTPSAYIALARDIVVLAGISILLWLVYRGGENSVKASDLKSLQAQIAEQAKITDRYHDEATQANDQLQKDMLAISAAPVVSHDWVRNTSCPEPVLPATAGQTSGQPAAAGGVQSGRGADAITDRRDSIVAEFKARWETEFAKCRALDTQWPH